MNFKFNWNNLTEDKYNNAIKTHAENPYEVDLIGMVYVGDICIELVNDVYYDNGYETKSVWLYNLYVAHEDTGYSYKNEYGYGEIGMPYDYADGGTMPVPYGLSYDKFKSKAEKLFTKYIMGCDNYFSYSLVEHANRPLEIW